MEIYFGYNTLYTTKRGTNMDESPPTTLPLDVWERIAGHLPPQKPKLVPMIYFRLIKDEDLVDDTPFINIHITKAVHEDEYNYLLDNLSTFDKLGLAMQDTKTQYSVYMHPYYRDEDYEQLEQHLIVEALGLGWDFASPEDRRAFDSRKKSFRLIRKP